MEHILYFFLYSCLGWVCECLYCGIPAGHFINRGFLAGPYCPVYGCGAVLVVYVLEPFQDHIVVLFLAGMILTSILEYVTGYLMEKLFHSKWWDYSNRRFNLHGRICLRNSLLFGVMGIVVVRIVHPFMASLLGRVPLVWQGIIAVVMSGLFLWDCVHTIHAILRENKDYRMLEASVRELAATFRSVSLFPLEEPLSQRITQILEQSDADEKLLKSLENLRAQYEKRLSAFRRTRQRLAAAFPKRLKEARQENAAALFAALQSHRKVFDRLRKNNDAENEG